MPAEEAWRARGASSVEAGWQSWIASLKQALETAGMLRGGERALGGLPQFQQGPSIHKGESTRERSLRRSVRRSREAALQAC
eukprot:2052060-Alexandrium_andersonii.AAC.1